MANQTIKCGVTSCKHNEKMMYCSLDTISISPNSISAKEKSETQCSNFLENIQ